MPDPLAIELALEKFVRFFKVEDEEVYAYLQGTLVDAQNEDEARELAEPFLLSSGKSPEEAKVLAERLSSAIFPAAATSADVTATAATSATGGVRKLDAPVCMAEGDSGHRTGATAAEEAPAEGTAVAGEQDEKTSAKLRRKERRAARQKGKSRDTSPADATATAEEAAEFQGVAELNEMDDWGSAWADVQASGERWGGRGKGGRGIQRATWQPRDVHVEGVTLTYQGVDLLQRTTLTFSHGHRYGLVGPNGVGKTTLMRRIAAGAVPGWPLHLRTYLVQQEALGGPENALATVLASDGRLRLLLDEEARLCDADDTATAVAAKGGNAEDAAAVLAARAERLEEVTADLEELGARQAEARAKAILEGLGFTAALLERPTAALSGGWRMRVALACALFCRPDLLLLDEPTNHLDMAGISWLTVYLQMLGEDTTVVVVSHDRAFLDAVATDIIHFHKSQLHYWPGNYSAFEKAREEKGLHLGRSEEAIQRQRKHMEDSIAKMRKAAAGKDGDQKKLSQVASREKKLKRHGMEKNVYGHRWKAQTEFFKGRSSIRAGSEYEDGEVWRDGTASRRSMAEAADKLTWFKFPEAEELSVHGTILQLRNVAFGWPGAATPLFEKLDMSIEAGARIAILAPNGAGKSTLLALLAGVGGGLHRVGAAATAGAAGAEELPLLEPTSGEILPYKNLRIGVFSQHHQDQLPAASTPLQHMQASFPRENEQTLRAYLGSFGITADLVHRSFAALSGGQRARVAFSELLHHRPHMLLLDEPTNHLDLQTVAALKEALKSYGGAVVLVSHDRDLVDGVAEELWGLRNRRVTRLEISVEQYAQELEDRARERMARGILA